MTDSKTIHDNYMQIVKNKVAELKADYEKLKAVDTLIGEHATETKKNDLVNSMFALQDVQQQMIDWRVAAENLDAT